MVLRAFEELKSIVLLSYAEVQFSIENHPDRRKFSYPEFTLS